MLMQSSTFLSLLYLLLFLGPSPIALGIPRFTSSIRRLIIFLNKDTFIVI